MWESLCDVLAAMPVAAAIPPAAGLEPGAFGSVANPYLRFVDVGGIRHQSITGDILLIVSHKTSDGFDYHMISPAGATKVRMPGEYAGLVSVHRHDYLEIVCLLEGSLDFSVEGERAGYQAGDCTVINQNVTHRELLGEEYLVLYVSLSLAYLDGLDLGRGGEGAGSFFARNLHPGDAVDYIDLRPIKRERAAIALEPTVTGLVRELCYRRPGFADIVRGLMTRLVHTLQDPALYACRTTRFLQADGADVFDRTVSYVLAQRRRLTRAEVGRAISYNANYINDVFLERTGVTLGSYIGSVCMQEAAHLLLNSDLSVLQIAERLGYSSRAGFYGQFKKRFGMSPAAWRARYRATSK
ncbi:helix-turn-helix transcriptional regulator [Collinsella tanakaei]|nr:helix-turn-helix transcriptional regulator [Collinsella tanakaei]